jgi:hypothetical protein
VPTLANNGLGREQFLGIEKEQATTKANAGILRFAQNDGSTAIRDLLQLLVVAGEAGVGFVDGGVFDADAAAGHLDELLAGLEIEVAREVFGRRVYLIEGLEVVDHLVVEIIDDGAKDLLEQLEVEEEAGLVELVTDERDEDFVVVAMRVLALALIVAEVVAGGESRFYGDFVHAFFDPFKA